MIPVARSYHGSDSRTCESKAFATSLLRKVHSAGTLKPGFAGVFDAISHCRTQLGQLSIGAVRFSRVLIRYVSRLKPGFTAPGCGRPKNLNGLGQRNPERQRTSNRPQRGRGERKKKAKACAKRSAPCGPGSSRPRATASNRTIDCPAVLGRGVRQFAKPKPSNKRRLKMTK